MLRNFYGGILLGTILAVALQLGGYLMVRDGGTDFGWAMFVAVPIVSGFAVAAVVRNPHRIFACTITGGIITFSVLLFTGWEGIICCLMSLPLVATGVAIGATLGYHVRGKFIDQLGQPGRMTLLVVLLSPFMIAGADRLEKPHRAIMRHEVFTTETTVPNSPAATWALVAEMEKMDGPKPLLLRMGLPTPMRCEVDRLEVGGKRICYFNSGTISQEITVWNAPHTMDFNVTGTTLPGRQWLTFIGAGYKLVPDGDKTRIIRETTIGTRLYPRWYWRPLERWGVTSEHEFVLGNFRRRAEEKSRAH